MDCEHEIYIKEEYYRSEEEIEIVCKCNICKKKFRGTIKRDGD